jgi:hypothetical protein
MENGGGEILTQWQASSNSLLRREIYSDPVVAGGGPRLTVDCVEPAQPGYSSG